MPYLIAALALTVTLAAFTGLARWSRKRGTAGSGLGAAMAAYDEAYHTTAYSSHQEQRAAADRKDQLGSPDDL